MPLPGATVQAKNTSTGVVSVTTPGNDIAQEVGQISLANFEQLREWLSW